MASPRRCRALGADEAAAAREASDAAQRAQAAAVVVARLGGGERSPLPVDPVTDRAALEREAVALLADADAAAAAAAQAADRARMAEAAAAERSPRRATADPELLAAVAVATGRLVAALVEAGSLAARFETPLQARVDVGARRTGELAGELRRLGAAEVEERPRADEAARARCAVDVELARLEAEAAEATRRLDRAATAERAEGDDRERARPRAERLERRREELGQVNPLAKEEYAAREGAARRARRAARRPRGAASPSSRPCAPTSTATVERRFDETFAAVAGPLRRGRRHALPGRRGPAPPRRSPRTRRARPGVEVELRPAGKRITRLSLLSGGEKALGAISFLFALFLARPCPFYLLDEVEAALDDTNIGRFVELLRRYADRAQFVVITHQKRTMEAADILYGVTMGDDGVTQIVSRRVPREREALAASAVATVPPMSRTLGESCSATPTRHRSRRSRSGPASSDACATRSARAGGRSRSRSRPRPSTRATTRPGSGSRRR